MRVKHIQCGPYANRGEAKAVAYLESHLTGLNEDGLWVLLSNLLFSISDSGASSEIDIVAIGPTGVHVIETKHWNFQYVDDYFGNRLVLDQEAEKIQRKAKIIGTTLRRFMDTGHLDGKFLLTRPDDPKYAPKTTRLHGTSLFAPRNWKNLLDLESAPKFTEHEVEKIAMLLEPASKAALTGDIRSFGGYINLERVSDVSEVFKRIYKGIHAKTRDKVILQIYDYSASTEAKCDTLARRESETIGQLSKSPWLPKLIESFQDAAEYPGELYFFSMADPGAPTLARRSADKSWTEHERLQFSIEVLRALHELHHPTDAEIPQLIHRNISPETIHIRSSGKPLFSGFGFTKLEGHTTMAGVCNLPDSCLKWIAPEVVQKGLLAADKSADVYSVCATLKTLFSRDDIIEILSRGLASDPHERPALTDIADALAKVGESGGPGEAERRAIPDTRYWDEDLELQFHGSTFRIANRLGGNGRKTTFKVIELDPDNREELGTYVAITFHDADSGRSAINAYRRARPVVSSHSHLAAVYETSREWQPDQITALLKWVDGRPLGDWAGVLELYAEEIGVLGIEKLLLGWSCEVCKALARIHRAGFVHGNVTPESIIVSGPDVVLTGYGLFTASGARPVSPGSPDFCSPAMENRDEVGPSDDIYALAATLFSVVFDRVPFEVEGETKKEQGCNWEGIDFSAVRRLVQFIHAATDPVASNRFRDADAALEYLELVDKESQDPVAVSPESQESEGLPAQEPAARTKQADHPSCDNACGDAGQDGNSIESGNGDAEKTEQKLNCLLRAQEKSSAEEPKPQSSEEQAQQSAIEEKPAVGQVAARIVNQSPELQDPLENILEKTNVAVAGSESAASRAIRVFIIALLVWLCVLLIFAFFRKL
jgi:serine/threonine protein kinase